MLLRTITASQQLRLDLCRNEGIRQGDGPCQLSPEGAPGHPISDMAAAVARASVYKVFDRRRGGWTLRSPTPGPSPTATSVELESRRRHVDELQVMAPAPPRRARDRSGGPDATASSATATPPATYN